MDTIAWSSQLETGIAIIDRDHKVLVDLLNQVAAVIGDGEERAVMGSVLNSLSEYTHYHFSREEKLQEVANYPGLEAHRRRHAVLAAQVDDIRSRYRDEPDAVKGEEVRSFLRTWLVEHILKEDMNYRAICAAHPEAVTAAEAIRFGDEPVEGSLDRAPRKVASVNWSTLKVLVVEDNRNFQLIISTILRSLGVRSITTADSGAGGLGSLMGGGVFDLVLSDWRMEEMDGLEFVRQARAAGVKTPIIMMTGYSDDVVREQARTVGVDAFLEKPITARGFLETAGDVLNAAATR
ncbi:bacteriohemerythrin [Novispirillum sp. DQ9]|uniref:bacteriohemerythrin n=1 Tax=Novispirillum sp. DQ9 TaxID=3398612 RepID=UPI003C7ED776